MNETQLKDAEFYVKEIKEKNMIGCIRIFCARNYN